MLKPNLSELLATSPAFANMTLEEVEQIVSRGRLVEVEKERPIFDQGMEAVSFFLLVDGYVRVVKTLPDGQQVIVRYFPSGELIGIAPALKVDRYPASAIAAIDCVALAWPSRIWPEIIQSSPAFLANVLQAVGTRLQESQDRLVEIATQRAEQRVALALLSMGEKVGKPMDAGFAIDFPLSRQDIAEMTATTLHTVSRLMAGWERQGLVRLGRQKVVVLSRQKLARLASHPEGASLH